MNDRRGIRVPMPKKREPFVAEDEIAVHVPEAEGRVGHRISMDIAEGVYNRMGREAIAHAVERIGKEVVFREQRLIEGTVHSFLRDREWAEPIIREAIRDAVHDVIADMFTRPNQEPAP